MLVLSRKKTQTIVLDGRITIKVLATKGGTVRIGIDAPKEMPVRRGELLDRSEAKEPSEAA